MLSGAQGAGRRRLDRVPHGRGPRPRALVGVCAGRDRGRRDPVADGPTIQAAGQRALRAGTTPQRVLELVRALRERTGADVPIVLMGYYNPIFRWGEARFVNEAVAAGADGVIVPDLPLEEAGPLLEAAQAHDFALIFLATPETPEARLKRLGEASRGFLYLVGRYGTTGAREALAPQTVELIRRTRRALPEGPPLAVGFGLARPEHVRGVIQAGADGAVVGSRLAPSGSGRSSARSKRRRAA